MSGRIALALLSGFVLGGWTASRAAAAFPGENGKIVFTSTRDGGDRDLFVMAADGSSPTNLTAGSGAVDQSPAWSADGTRIAFGSGRNWAAGDVFVMAADGSSPVNLTPGGDDPNDPRYDDLPGFSPDGGKLVFQSSRDDLSGDIFTMGVDGSSPVNLTPAHVVAGSGPRWSPDGTKIAFEGPGSSVWVMAPDGSSPVNLTPEPPQDSYPDWSPDGTKIAFASRRDGGDYDIFVMNADGSSPTNLTPASTGEDWEPAFSPDGTKIAFTSLRPAASNTDIYVMDADGSSPTNLTPGSAAQDSDADWQPIPTQVIFVHGFLGSKIFCGNEEVWPALPFPALPRIALGRDGQTTPNCAAAGPKEGQLLETALGSDVYQSTVNFLSSEFPNSFHLYAWDWRKSPEEAIAGLDALVDRVRQPGRKVVLMAHSMGGLVTRLYVGDQTRADKVSRVLTAGTPYFGSPKALFPFVYGVESPGLSGLDAVIANEAMLPFARYMQGMFFLWPSARYGGWLSIEGRRPSPLGRVGVLNLVDERGGNPSLLSNALAAHAQRIDSFATGGTDYQTIVGTGVHTIGAIRVDRAPAQVRTLTGAFDIDERDIVRVTWTNGDGTVPLKSAIGSTPDVRKHFTCGIPHVPLPGHISVTTRVQDFLAAGDPIPDGFGPSSLVCSPQGFALSIYPLADGIFSEASASVHSAGSPAALSLEQAEAAGLVESLNTGRQIEAATSTSNPLSVKLKLKKGAALQIAPMADGRRGRARSYVAKGKGTLAISLGDTAAVRLGRKKLKARRADKRAPKTRVTVRARGKSAVLSFKVKDASPTTTWVRVGKRARRVKQGRLRLPAKQLRRGVLVLSIDAFGNAEKPKRSRLK